jgi:NitT/TauT family transport system substrate-binding protein
MVPRLVPGIAVLLVAGAASADEISLQLKWVTQAQFAGYYAAEANGYYRDLDLDVTILPGGPDISPPQVIAGRGADVMVDWMPSALAARERGVPLVNIAQVFQDSGLRLVCRTDSGIATSADFPGHNIAVWFAGNEYPFLAWMNKLGYSVSGSTPDITLMRQGFNIDPLLTKDADCIAGMSYNEGFTIPAAGLTDADVKWFSYDEAGVGVLEDGLYVLEDDLADPAKVDRFARFLAASLAGWRWAAAHGPETVEILLEADPSGMLAADYQTFMMAEVARLVFPPRDPQLGFLDPADYERTVAVLLGSGSEPVITKAPEGAWSHVVWEAAQPYLQTLETAQR